MRVADFFCGGGGFSEGFRQAGFDIVFAVDRWTPAVKTYLGNKPGVKVIQDDVIRISQLPDDEFEALVPDSEVIIGSLLVSPFHTPINLVMQINRLVFS